MGRPDVWVLSPHLDDAILSLGSSIARWSRRGHNVRIVTVLAGDPHASFPAGSWDAASGFGTAGEAARTRREEDRRACSIVRATPIWLPYNDRQYERGAADETIWDTIVASIDEGETVLAPGYPLAHKDHAWLTTLVLSRRRPSWRVGLYVEQPYALRLRRPESNWLPSQLSVLERPPSFRPQRASWRDRRRKRMACRSYQSQFVPLCEWGTRTGSWDELEQRLHRRERDNGGELVGWIERPIRWIP